MMTVMGGVRSMGVGVTCLFVLIMIGVLYCVVVECSWFL